MKGKVFLVALAVICCALFSYYLAYHTIETDFPAFYRAASIMLSQSTANTEIYLPGTTGEYGITEHPMPYRYSMVFTYLISPLALLPYLQAKAVFIFICCTLYLASIYMLLRILSPDKRVPFLVVISFFWSPFLYDLRNANTNCIILFCLVAACVIINKKRPWLGGAIIGFAALIKVFPIAIAMVLGLKNWRIFTGCLALFAIGLILPGSPEWIASIGNPPIAAMWHSLAFQLAGREFNVLYLSYVFIVAGITALFAYRTKSTNIPVLFSFAICGMLLTLPVHEYYYLTLAIFPLLYLLSHSTGFLATISILAINLAAVFFWFIHSLVIAQGLLSLSLIILWGLFITMHTQGLKRPESI